MTRSLKFMMASSLALSIGAAAAQSADPEQNQEREETVQSAPVILIDDPKPSAIEYSESQGAADSELLSEAEREVESETGAALQDDMSGDMAAMPEIAEKTEW